VLALLSSPSTAGLFRAAISLSGVDVSLPAETARSATEAIAEVMGVPATAEGFGPTDDGAATRAILRMRDDGPSDTTLTLGPVHGDPILPQPITVGLRMHGHDIPVLLGATADEFDGGPTVEDPWRPDPTTAAAIAAKAAGTRATDIMFRAACVRTAAARSGSTAGTWLYSFDWPSPVTAGATHCIDLPFFFDNLQADGVTQALGEAPPRSLANGMHSDVTSFVLGAEPSWPRATGVARDAARVYGADGFATVGTGAYDAILDSDPARHVSVAGDWQDCTHAAS
jgi:para-nitrobenzyl esterase